MAHAQWAVSVRSLDSGELLYALNPGRMMVPASNMKILTLAAAGEALGWDRWFTTTLETSGSIDAGVLRGDLIVRGVGDPTINTREGRGAAVFAEWCAALQALGIHEIDGRVIGDDQFFDDEGLGAGWAWDYLQYGYAAPVGALQFNENVASLAVLPGAAAGDPAIVTFPAGTGLGLWNRAITGAPGTPETIEFRRHLDRPMLEITGSVPLAPVSPGAAADNIRTAVRQVAVVNPTLFFAQALEEALTAAGIRVTGAAADFDDVAPALFGEGGERRVLASTVSPPLRDIASVLMKSSQNLYAETLLKAIAAAAGGLGTTAGGRSAVLKILQEWDIDQRSLVMVDGSGLSRYNYVTADLLTSLLARMYADAKHRDPFMAALPIAGRDGTLSTRLRGTRAEGNALAKTGSISNVRALSGYVRTRDGEMLAFSILANDFVVPSATVNWITDLAVEILANFTRERN